MWIMCFFFNDTATTEIYTLSLHDALPILDAAAVQRVQDDRERAGERLALAGAHLGDRAVVQDHAADHLHVEVPHAHRALAGLRSEEHTSELQSRQYLVCRLLLEKKNNIII